MVETRVHRCQFCAAPLERSDERERLVRCRYCGRQNELAGGAPPLELPDEAAPPAPARPSSPWIAVAVLAVAAIGVGVGLSSMEEQRSGGPRPPSLDGPFSMSWADDSRIVVDGKDDVYARVSLFEGHYQITFHKFPVGTRWAVGERSGILDSDIYAIVRLGSIEDELGAVPVARFRNHAVGPTETLEVQIPSGHQATIALRPLPVGYTLRQTLQAIENGPVRFEPEPARGERNSVALLETAGLKVFGPAQTMRDVDQLAVVRVLPELHGEKRCGGQDARGRPLPEVTLRLKETEVIVYDRRTGDVAERRVFPPDDRCPTLALSASRDARDTYPPTRDIEAWLATLVRR